MYFFLFAPSFAQTECEFNIYTKRGGLFYFSTFYTDYSLSEKKEGECTKYDNGKPYEKRVFKNGRLQEESQYAYGEQRLRSQFKLEKKDSVIATLEVYDDLGRLTQRNTYFFGKAKRRCWREELFANNRKRSQCFYRNIHQDELAKANLNPRPENQIDDEGYTDISVKFGEERFYDDNGNLSAIQHHKFRVTDSYTYNELLDGPYKSYWQNGKLRETGAYKEGGKHGKWYSYYDTGKKYEIQEFENSVNVGELKAYYPDGNVQRIVEYGDQYYWPTGFARSYFNNGDLMSESVTYANGKGYVRSYFDNGVLQEELIVEYSPNDVVQTTRRFRDGRLREKTYRIPVNDTLSATYYEDGTLSKLNLLYRDVSRPDNYKQIILDNWTTGVPHSYSETEMGDGFVRQYMANYNQGGSKLKEIIIENKNRVDREFWDNGILKKEKASKDNFLDGLLIQQAEDGRLLKKCFYENGIRVNCTINTFQKVDQISDQEMEKALIDVYEMLNRTFYSSTDTLPVLEVEVVRRALYLGYFKKYMSVYYPEITFPPAATELKKMSYYVTIPQGVYEPNKARFDSLLQAMTGFEQKLELIQGQYQGQIDTRNFYSLKCTMEMCKNASCPLGQYFQSNIYYPYGEMLSLPSNQVHTMERQGEAYAISFTYNYQNWKVVVYETGEVEWQGGEEPQFTFEFHPMYKD
jgi:antitoxin component YwqK of YwqJK toxin-antitoxin module